MCDCLMVLHVSTFLKGHQAKYINMNKQNAFLFGNEISVPKIRVVVLEPTFPATVPHR